MTLPFLRLGFVVFLLIAVSTPSVRGQSVVPPNAIQAPPAAIDQAAIKKVKQATVYIKVETADGSLSEGSGLFAVEPGIVLTNAHVVGMLPASAGKPRKIDVVVHSGDAKEFKLSGTVVGVDHVNDLAVLRVDKEQARWPAPLAIEFDMSGLAELQKVYIFGFPLGAELGKEITASESSISSFRKDADGRLFQIQVNGGMHPGNSGGPVVDSRGVVIGVAVAGVRGTSINFAVPGEKLHGVIFGRVDQTSLGQAFRDDKQVKLPIKTAFLDPLQRIRDVKLDVWTGPIGANRPASLKAPVAVAGDSARQTVGVKYETGVASLDLPLPAVPAGKAFWIQAVFDGPNGTRQWGPALSFDPAAVPPLERVPANFTIKTDAQIRTLKMVSRQETLVSKGANQTAECYLMEKDMLEVLFKYQGGNLIRVALGKGDFHTLDGGIKTRRNPAAQAFIQRNVWGYACDDHGKLNHFGFVKHNHKDPILAFDATEMACDVAMSYMTSNLSLPNRELKALENWDAAIRILFGGFTKKKDSIDLDLKCRYEGSRTVNGRIEAFVSLAGDIGAINNVKPQVRRPSDKVTGWATFDVEAGMFTKLAICMSAEFELAGSLVCRTYEINLTRTAGNIHNIAVPAIAALSFDVNKGKMIYMHESELEATDAANPHVQGAFQKAFPIQLKAGRVYAIDLRHHPANKLDPFLRLEDAAGTILAEDDDGLGNLNARVVYKVGKTGQYNIIATSFTAGQTGEFRINVTDMTGVLDMPEVPRLKTEAQ